MPTIKLVTKIHKLLVNNIFLSNMHGVGGGGGGGITANTG
jgi:hypothetical protein